MKILLVPAGVSLLWLVGVAKMGSLIVLVCVGWCSYACHLYLGCGCEHYAADWIRW